MAIHRTKIQKQKAAEKRKLEYGYNATDGHLEQLSPEQVAVTETTKIHQPPHYITKPLDSGLAHHIALTSAYLGQDLRKTLLVTGLLGVLLIGIWLATRYNGMSSLF